MSDVEEAGSVEVVEIASSVEVVKVAEEFALTPTPPLPDFSTLPLPLCPTPFVVIIGCFKFVVSALDVNGYKVKQIVDAIAPINFKLKIVARLSGFIW